MAGLIELAQVAETSYEEVKRTVNGIIELLRRGEPVLLKGLGTFSIDVKASHTVRNPQTGEVIEKPAMMVPKFDFHYPFKKEIAETIPVNEEVHQKKLKRRQYLKDKFY